MRRYMLLAGAFMAIAGGAYSDSELVIAIRYLQAEGPSHSHLYLYREGGKLSRQLTNDNSDKTPLQFLCPTGETIVFTRQEPNNLREFWSVEPRGTNLKKLDAAPDWYSQAKSSPYFTNTEPDQSASATPTASAEESASPTVTQQPAYRSLDGSVELACQCIGGVLRRRSLHCAEVQTRLSRRKYALHQ